MITDANFSKFIDRALDMMRLSSSIVHSQKWQGVDVSKKPEMAMHELRHVFAQVPMPGEELGEYRSQIQPNLPWADDHFEERVCGQPINPGLTWKTWPHSLSAQNFLDASGKFNHNYMERYWPKYAGWGLPTKTADDYKLLPAPCYQQRGIYHPYGDLNDVVAQFIREPQTRQAVLPVFFPEDTGAVHGGRIPCSLFYQFFMRDGRLDVSYVLRSCDIVRHFRDDLYLTARLALWVLDQCRAKDKGWRRVKPGQFVILITSLHCFRNDFGGLA